MYIPAAFRASDDDARALLTDATVGQLVTATEQGPLATLIPVLVDMAEDQPVVRGHLARPNAQWQTPWIGDAMFLVQGPEGYVSPSWYASKAEDPKVVPTWNKVAVHAYGELVVRDDPAWLAGFLRELTDRHERDRTEPWSVDDAPAEFIDKLLGAIVGIELRVARIEAVVKMSQNKPERDIASVAAGLEADGVPELARWVRTPRP